MKKRVKVADVRQLAERGTLRVTFGSEPVCLYNLGGTIHATHDRCTHGSASLSYGVVEGEYVQCPLHHGEFHIPTGKAVGVPCTVDLKVFTVELDGESVYIVGDAI
jgi:ethylbenzene dioxygenase ferredoxin subunit